MDWRREGDGGRGGGRRICEETMRGVLEEARVENARKEEA